MFVQRLNSRKLGGKECKGYPLKGRPNKEGSMGLNSGGTLQTVRKKKFKTYGGNAEGGESRLNVRRASVTQNLRENHRGEERNIC